DHGTALDIAWQGVANATSLYFAIEWVAQHSAEGRHPAEI
ncbi:MAG: 4-hydroxythreonine-4-phosphate dehydrogenase PdxA, partial [Planctomycetales bacterium]|nr:4-hydroxythreonine-4-phosphate dehydrogenase PdxA [Planctomycetales bacterium]